jgi:rRNA small subunit pseudouridine methyltransferase Nep1
VREAWGGGPRAGRRAGRGGPRIALFRPAAAATTPLSPTSSLSIPLSPSLPSQAYALLNCDDHATFLRKHGRDPAASRPDIAHQALLALYDSPLAKAGRLQSVYVHTQKGALVSVHPAVRLPRTFKRFCGLWVQLLHKLAIRAANGPDKLLRVVKGPVARHLPPGCPRIALSRTAPDAVPLKDLVAGLEPGVTPVFVVGAMAHGRADAPYVDR